MPGELSDLLNLHNRLMKQYWRLSRAACGRAELQEIRNRILRAGETLHVMLAAHGAKLSPGVRREAIRTLSRTETLARAQLEISSRIPASFAAWASLESPFNSSGSAP